METIRAKVSQNPPPKFLMALQTWLRVLAGATALTAACTMITNKQSLVLYGTVMDARYDYASAFKFFAVANLIACAFTIAALFIVFGMAKASTSMNYFYLFLHDLVIMALLMGGNAAAMTVAYVGKYGYSRTGWMPICDNFTKFCNKILICIGLSFVSLVCYLSLTIISVKSHAHVHRDQV